MRIDTVELRVVALPMPSPFESAHGTVGERSLVLVRVVGPEGEGWGECGALPRPTYTDEFVDQAVLVLRDHLAPRLLDAARSGGVAGSDVDAILSDVVGHPMAKAALELAVLDAEGRRDGRALVDRLVADRTLARPEVSGGVAVGLHDTTAALVDEVVAHVGAGYGRVKLKIAPGRDEERVRAVRDAVNDALELVVDANGAYRLDGAPGDVDDARGLTWLADYGVGHVEQPLAADDLLGHAALAQQLDTPICLDESLTTERATRDALELGACSVVCVKAPRYGSWLAAARVLDRCEAAGVPAWVGGMLDGGLGRAANLALAAHPAATVTGDISGTARFFTDDVTPFLEPLARTRGGHLRFSVPSAPGIGASVDPAALARLTRHHEIVASFA
ncbi:o-succinylbenzoate synthase [Rhabdothermincola salaria]|uniref:o-succinylbenzoate synthase n=1 Tax=Rhabdothermincola salaria TaxID=2903142 RepID=UPI001E4FA89B|nr:o-succinylbenzoate synthase [Rhabdothermincola salaria]